MIRGYFLRSGMTRRPFVDVSFMFSPHYQGTFEVPLLVDTGADRTMLAPLDAMRLAEEFGIDLLTLPRGTPSTGVGGRMETRTIEATLTLDTFSAPLMVTILEPRPPLLSIPSLLGRDILSRFALYIEQAQNLVLLLEPAEAATLRRQLP